MKRLSLILLLPCVLGACIDRTSMQSRYDKQRDHCRGEAEKKTGRAVEKEDIAGENVRSPADATRNKQLAANFSECMFTQGWTIATPAPIAVATVPGKPPVGTPVAGAGGGVVAGSTAAGYGTPGPYANNSTYPGQVVSGPVQASRLPPGTTVGKAAGQGLPGSPAGAAANMPAPAYYVPPAAVVVTQGAPATRPARTLPVAPATRPAAKKAGAPVYTSGSPQATFDAEFEAAH